MEERVAPATLATLVAQRGIRFVVVGGVAENLHGSARVTFDLDIVYDPSPDNQARIIALLTEWKAWLYGGTPDLPWLLDERTLVISPVLTLMTSHGRLDLMDRIDGVGDYVAALRRSIEVTHRGTTLRMLDLDSLILSKRATGRLKDVGPVIELEALREKLRAQEPPAVRERVRRPRAARRSR